VRRILTVTLLLAVSIACSSDGETGQGQGAVVSTIEAGPATIRAAPGGTGLPEAPPQPVESPPQQSGIVTLNAVGDLMLARDVITIMNEHGSSHPFAAVRHLLADADITIGNMEGTYSERGVAANKKYTFRTPPRHAQGLAEAGIDIVSLGNNHAMDFGPIALADTRAALDAAGVRHSGAGANAAAARQPAVIEANGLKLAFLSYNAVTESTPATDAAAGVAWGNEPSIRADVDSARRAADIIVLSLHAGTEYQDAPTAAQRQLARIAIDAGATLVLGHHAHVFQGWEHYGRGVIVYGLGNFVFDLDPEDYAMLGPRPFQAAIMRFELTREGVTKVEARPVFIDPAENRPIVPQGETRRLIEQRIERLNAGLR
jgi:poly-gamma-glutamate synthesis protein (capsule biosynthesis protein)